MTDRFDCRLWLIDKSAYATPDEIDSIMAEFAYVGCFDNNIEHGRFGYHFGPHPTVIPEWCTGRKDIKDNRIYAGDIVEFFFCGARSAGFVKYDDYECLFEISVDDGDGLFFFHSGASYEVIGNIHENGDLLK